MKQPFRWSDALALVVTLVAVVAVTAGFRFGLHLTNPTTAALSYLLIVLVTAAASTLWVAIGTSILADLCLNYFFMPPFGAQTHARGRGRDRSAGRMTSPARILLVDDELSIQRALTPLLRSRGYDVDVAGTGQEALRRFAEHQPDLIVLDLGLPDIEGTDVCRRVRESSSVPIIILSARGRETDKVAALDLEADDYVTKPFGPEELLARIRVWLRRILSEERVESGRVAIADLTIDYDRHRVLRGEAEIRLTPKEFELLAFMARNPDRVMTHRAILKAVWGPNAVDQPEHLWVLVAQVRKKIEIDPAAPRYLVSEPWVGYQLATEAPAPSE